MTEEQTPKEKAEKYMDKKLAERGDDYIYFEDVSKAMDIALSELQKQHEAKIKEIQEWLDNNKEFDEVKDTKKFKRILEEFKKKFVRD